MILEEALQKTLRSYNSTLALLGKEQEEEKFTEADIIYIHDTMIADYGGSYGIRDKNLLDSVVKAPYQSCFEQDLYPTIFDKAAKLLYDFCNYQIFIDGNKRTSVAVSNTLLLVNNYKLTLTDVQMYQLAMDISNHRITLEEVRNIFNEKCKISLLEDEYEPDKAEAPERD